MIDTRRTQQAHRALRNRPGAAARGAEQGAGRDAEVAPRARRVQRPRDHRPLRRLRDELPRPHPLHDDRGQRHDHRLRPARLGRRRSTTWTTRSTPRCSPSRPSAPTRSRSCAAPPTSSGRTSARTPSRAATAPKTGSQVYAAHCYDHAEQIDARRRGLEGRAVLAERCSTTASASSKSSPARRSSTARSSSA